MPEGIYTKISYTTNRKRNTHHVSVEASFIKKKLMKWYFAIKSRYGSYDLLCDFNSKTTQMMPEAFVKLPCFSFVYQVIKGKYLQREIFSLYHLLKKNCLLKKSIKRLSETSFVKKSIHSQL